MSNSMNKQRRICLVTWIGGGNFGTALQSFSLHYYLQKVGYDVSFLGILPENKQVTFSSYLKIALEKIGLYRVKSFFGNRNVSLKRKKFNQFVSKYYSITNLRTNYQLNCYINHVDVFISGSDQIWNTFFRYDPKMFLNFVTGKRKVAYASSIGANGFKLECQNEVKQMLLDFFRIGVREREAINTISELTGRQDIVQVLDPTFLLSSKQWSVVISNSKIEFELPKLFIFCYLIGNNNSYKEHLLEVQRKTGIQSIIIVPSEENPMFNIDGAIVYSNAGPLEFVYLISRSSFVCTDSFHATALSINFQKNFVEFIRFKDGDIKSQNSRIYDVLTHYGLMNRIYSNQYKEWSLPIQYEDTISILEADRKKSEEFLLDAIEE